LPRGSAGRPAAGIFVMQEGALDPARRTLDVAYHLLRDSGRPMDTRTLLMRALELAGQPEARLAEAYTALNLDVRFVPFGGGEWGLREWGKGRRTQVPEESETSDWE
jgi:DNA-directed RNA polymerase delta subunit